jgi:Glycosyl transferase family 2
MITVVIPTMWKYKPFLQFLKDLVGVPSIGEIIIIDNNPSETPDDPLLKYSNDGLSKINLLTYGYNIYVNPAWNLGVKIAKHDNICLLNDDVIVDLKLFSRMDKFLKPGIGLCGISPGLSEEFGHVPITSGEIELQHTPFPYNPRAHFGLGTLMFFPKSEYIPIIEGLDLYWGDNFIYDTLFLKLNQNYLITNCFYHSPNAQTTSTIENANEIMARENFVYNSKMPEIFHGLERQYRGKQ